MKVRGIYESCGNFAANLYMRMKDMVKIDATYDMPIEAFVRALVRPIKEMERQPQKNHKLRAGQFEKSIRRSLFSRVSMAYKQEDIVVWNAIFVSTAVETDKKT